MGKQRFVMYWHLPPPSFVAHDCIANYVLFRYLYHKPRLRRFCISNKE